MICKNCGAKIDDGDVFCGQCGESIADAHNAGQNAAMDKQQIIKYLEIGVDLEKQRYLQERTLECLDERIKSLGVRERFSAPVRRTNNVDYGNNLVGGAVAGCAVGFILGIVIGFLPVGISIGTLIGLGLGAIVARNHYSSEEKNIDTEHQRQMNTYFRNLEQDKKRVENELEQKAVMASEKQILYKQYEQTKASLDKYYAKGIIYKNYHYDFTAIASFLDYFKSGRCSTLGERNGGDGAYNEYAKDVRCQMVLTSIGEVLKSLEEIKSNQWSLYSAIKEGNSISEKLLEKTKRIVTDVSRIASATEQTAANTAIGAYAAQEAAKELRYLNWIETNNYFNR